MKASLREEIPMRTLVLGLLLATSAFARDPVVVISTTKGDIKVQLDARKAPVSVENFLEYVRDKHYDGTLFHRVIKGFMIQGGGFDPDLKEKGPLRSPIKNEAGNGLQNRTGTIAMARTNVVDSATAQFFINVKDNKFLDHRDDSPRGFGYAVFGKVISGMNVVRKIESLPTQTRLSGDGVPLGDIPAENVVIKSIHLVK